VTSAQRARLVVAMGLLNLILATVALTAGLVTPTQPDRDIAGGTSPNPGVIAPSSSSGPTASSPSTTGPGGSPTVPGSSGSAPPVSPGPSSSIEPSASPAPSGPLVAQGPTPTPPSVATASPSLGNGQTPAPTATPPPIRTPSPTATPRATPRPTAQPTPQPTARPTPTPTPVLAKARKPRPPCPSVDTLPPGHHRSAEPGTRPCGGKGEHPKGGGGVVIVLPIALFGLVASGPRRLAAGARRVRGLARRRPA
jgi:hypothetical protein